VTFNIRAVSAGKSQTLALLMSGEVLGWGGAGSGRYNPGYVDICSTPKSDGKPVYVGASLRLSCLSAGYGVSLGASTQQELLVWGWNPLGVGGDLASSEIPTPIDGISAPIALAAGQSIFAAIDQAGSLYTWGLNVDHALGRTTEQMNALPGLVHGVPTMLEVAVGDNFMIVLSREGEVFSFGSNSAGQLGLGHLRNVDTAERVPFTASKDTVSQDTVSKDVALQGAASTPTASKDTVSTLTVSIKSIAVGATHVLALCREGNVYAWGSNQYGQLGHQRNRYDSQPTLIQMPEKITALAAGTHFSLALTESGDVYAWGWNGFGQLATNDTRPRSTPTKVLGLTQIQAIAAGEMHALALGKKALYGWGSNDAGQLGRAAQQQVTPFPFWENS
jgi:alpha-tubulin suppressor-like RCC1 family protein